MFEKAIPTIREFGAEGFADLGDGELLIGNAEAAPAQGGGALRALEWNEVTARLNAARDLRLLMRRDSRLNIDGGAASFGDAAATYFRALETEERPVNLDALEQGKASSGIASQATGDAAQSDARDD
ncbi:hypothetical protein ACI5KX_02080 [Erythrobacter sp. GH1-10]|uniref:hypothetical protein n=1 Tax=Erythrobacter sp. GH1-10 TaxID=3349334 RepID=UPI003877E245